MRKMILITLTMTFLINCNNNQSQMRSTNTDDTLTFKSQLTNKQGGVPYYQSDDYFAFKIEPDTKNIGSLYQIHFSCSKESVINKQDSTLIDTVFTYIYKNDKIKIYKTTDKDLLTLFDVTDTIFEINGKIRPGISKDYFSKKFNIKGLINDTVDIGNIEHTFVIRFYFKNDKLKRIMTEPYFD